MSTIDRPLLASDAKSETLAAQLQKAKELYDKAAEKSKVEKMKDIKAVMAMIREDLNTLIVRENGGDTDAALEDERYDALLAEVAPILDPPAPEKVRNPKVSSSHQLKEMHRKSPFGRSI